MKYKTIKLFDCRDLPLKAGHDLAYCGIKSNIYSIISIIVSLEMNELFDLPKSVYDWLLDNGAKHGETIIMKYHW